MKKNIIESLIDDFASRSQQEVPHTKSERKAERRNAKPKKPSRKAAKSEKINLKYKAWKESRF